MNMAAILPLIVALALPVAALYGVSRLSRWWVGRHDPIDDLIAKNAAQPRDGMHAMDWHKNNSAGERRWQETLQAQMRARKPRVLPMAKRRA